MQSTTQSQLKNIFILVGIFLAVTIVGTMLFGGGSTSGIEVVSAPSNANVTINNKSHRTGKIGLDPGSYTVEVTREGFQSNTQSVDVSDNTYTTIHVALTPVSDEAQAWARRNIDLYREIEAAAGTQAQEKGNQLREKNPVISVLPYRGVLFSIDYRLADNDPNRVVLIVDASTAQDRAFAVARIRSMGYEPTDYEIEFSGLSNLPWSQNE